MADDAIVTSRRVVMPMNTANELVSPGAFKRTIRGECKNPFTPERMFISGADVGGDGRAANWEIDDIRIDGVTIRKIRNGNPMNGDYWSTERMPLEDSDLVEWRRCLRDIEIDVRYVGDTVGGTPFYGSIIGTQP